MVDRTLLVIPLYVYFGVQGKNFVEMLSERREERGIVWAGREKVISPSNNF